MGYRNTLTVVSLPLMVGVVGLWVDGYWHHMGIENQEGEGVLSCQGVVIIGVSDSNGMPSSWFWFRTPITHSDNSFNITDSYGISFLGFGHSIWRFTSSGGFILSIPYWFLTLIFAVPPGAWFIKWRKRRKLAMVGSCPSCGYDLTGNESGVCPECGAKAAKTSSQF